ncbi:MAG TPA: TonB-dependent hemoglobin/transferrin/lactoferrin family receptor [Dongiaceae bacterium]|nr:TonB-dependent hemoglobin/transferrin/lactoferrin family receptor [Dongiaceae bacterium]
MLRDRLLSAVITSTLACSAAAIPLLAVAQEASQSPATSTSTVADPVQATPPKAADKKAETTGPGGQAQQQPAQSIMLDPLTVTATKAPAPRDSVPASIDVITQDQIDRKQPLTVGDILDDLPGVEMEGGPKGSQSQPNIRGFGGTGWGTNRVVTTLDGARQDVGAAHGGSMFFDPELLKQVEVLKGTGSTLYGSGAIGGVIALTTKDASDFLEGDDKYGFWVKSGYHTVNKEPMASGTFALRPIDQVDFLGNFTWRDSGNYKTGAGDRLNDTAVEVMSGLMKLGITPGEGQRLELSGIIFHDNEDALDTDVGNLNTEYKADHEIKKTTASAHYTFNSPDSDLVNFSATAYRDDTDVDSNGRSYDRDTSADLTTTGLDIFNTFKFDTSILKHALTIGTEYYHDAGGGRVNGDKEPQNPDATQDVVGLYAQDAIKLFDQLTLTPGLRWDYYATNPEGGDFSDRKDNRFSPKIGINWQPVEWASVYGSYSQGYRAPSVRELYISGIHFALGGPFNNTFVPNPDLKPESTKTWEGGLRFNFEDVLMKGDGLRFRGNYFDTRAKNFIDGDVVIDFANNVFTTTPVNVPRAHIRGSEIELSYDSEYAFFSGGYSRIRGDNLTDDEPLTSIPADKLVVTLGAKIPTLDIAFGVTDEYAWSQDRVADADLAVGNYNVVGLFAGWAPSDGPLKGFRVNAGIDNLFDKNYERFLAEEKAPGRDYYFAVSYGQSF